MSFFGSKYDTKKPILDTIVEARNAQNEVPDTVYTDILAAYGIPEEREEEIMQEMLMSTEYTFGRTHNGWYIMEIN